MAINSGSIRQADKPFLSGTFTPALVDASGSISEGQTYAQQEGAYRRIGDLIFFWIDIEITSLGTLTPADDARISGLPFSAASFGTAGTADYAISIGSGGSLALAGIGAVCGYVISNSSTLRLLQWTSTGGTTNIKISEVSVGGHLRISGHYIAT